MLKRCQFIVFALSCLVLLGAALPVALVEAETFRSVNLNSPSNPYQQLSELELQLYQKAYLKQPIRKRLERLEKSVYGPEYRGLGSSRSRIEGLLSTFRSQQQEQQDQNRKRTLSFLETRLWGYDAKHLSIEERVAGLERSLLQPEDETPLPLDERLDRLARLIPVGKQGFRVSLANEPTADEVIYPTV